MVHSAQHVVKCIFCTKRSPTFWSVSWLDFTRYNVLS
nr:MAG TPA: hypothetical protein [Caudoviricetes sp.]